MRREVRRARSWLSRRARPLSQRRQLRQELHRVQSRCETQSERLALDRERLAGSEAAATMERLRVERLRIDSRSPIGRRGLIPADAEVHAGVPSFAESLRWHRRNRARLVWDEEGFVEPVLAFDSKLVARRYAAAHGVAVPELFGSWATPDDIDWDDLPDRFVVKSTHSLGSYAVFPLRREGEVYIDGITRQPVTREEVSSALWARHRDEAVYFAEEYLSSLVEVDRMPHDIKVFCCYGRVVFLEIRRDVWNRLGRDGIPRVRTFLPDGTELHAPRPFMSAGRDLPGPRDLPAIVEAASRLSAGVRRPFVRIDFYETSNGLVFGEFGKNPQHTPALLPSLDECFGVAYEEAFAAVLNDLATEGFVQETAGRAPVRMVDG